MRCYSETPIPSGTVTRSVVPAPGADSIVSEPSTSATRSLIPTRPSRSEGTSFAAPVVAGALAPQVERAHLGHVRVQFHRYCVPLVRLGRGVEMRFDWFEFLHVLRDELGQGHSQAEWNYTNCFTRLLSLMNLFNNMRVIMFKVSNTPLHLCAVAPKAGTCTSPAIAWSMS